MQSIDHTNPDRKPLVSVIVPVFNAAGTLAATLQSVLRQTMHDFEIVAVDDGSKDDSLAILMSFAAQDRRIRVLSGLNRGVSAARNRGARAARGQLLAFLDADDVWALRKLEAHVALHRARPRVAISYAQVAFISRHHEPGAHLHGPIGALSLDGGVEAVLAENPLVTASNLVITREAFERLDGFSAELRFAEDQELLLRALRIGLEVEFHPMVLVGYRENPLGLSAQLDSMLASWRVFASRYGSWANLRVAEAIYCRSLARRALRGGQPPFTALRFALRGLWLHAAGFLSDPRRGGLTLGAAFVNPLLPPNVRARLFS